MLSVQDTVELNHELLKLVADYFERRGLDLSEGLEALLLVVIEMAAYQHIAPDKLSMAIKAAHIEWIKVAHAPPTVPS